MRNLTLYLTILTCFIVSMGWAQEKVDTLKFDSIATHTKPIPVLINTAHTDSLFMVGHISPGLFLTTSNPMLIKTDTIIKRDTIFILFLEIPSGYQLNPASWTIGAQSNIDLVWKRGFAVRHWEMPYHPDYLTVNERPYPVIDYYMYIDKKTKVTNKVVMTINPKQ